MNLKQILRMSIAATGLVGLLMFGSREASAQTNDEDCARIGRICTTPIYNSKGQKIKEILEYNGSGSPNKILIYEYDTKGNRISAKVIESNSDETPIIVTTYKYDNKGTIIEAKEIIDANADGNPEAIKTNWYNHEGKRTKRKIIEDSKDNGSPDTIITYWYGSNGREIRSEMFRESSVNGFPICSMSNQEYDDKGNVVKNKTVYFGCDTK